MNHNPQAAPVSATFAMGRRLSRGFVAVRLSWQAARALAAIWFTLLGLSAAQPLVVAWVGKLIVDAVMAHKVERALWLVAAELGLAMTATVAFRGSQTARNLLGTRLGLKVNQSILRKALTFELEHFQNPVFYDALSKARREASVRPLAVTTEIVTLLSSVLTLCGVLALLLSLTPFSVLVLVFAALPASWSELRYSRALFDLRNARTAQVRRLSYLEYLLTNDEHAKEVMMNGLGPTLLGRYETQSETLWHEETRLAVRRTVWGTVLSQLSALSFYSCYFYLVYRTAQGHFSLGELTMYTLVFRQGQQSVHLILAGLGALYEHDLYMSNLLSFLALPTEKAPLQLTAHSTMPERGIRFDDVGFRYPDQPNFVLRHIRLWIPAGQSLAVVGHNGVGKTTFIKLLTGLYQPTEGRVLLDGEDLRTLPSKQVRQRLAVVFQDYNQYQFTAQENIALGDPPRAADTAQVHKAIEEAGAGPVIDSLPSGLSTQLGRWFENGVELSGGQWQRLALARALMRREADIVVLDEPTASLDVDSETELFGRMRDLAQGRTLVLISHRFPTVRIAEHIVVLEKSGICEQGSHAQLIAQNGLYAAMFRKQAAGYSDESPTPPPQPHREGRQPTPRTEKAEGRQVTPQKPKRVGNRQAASRQSKASRLTTSRQPPEKSPKSQSESGTDKP